MNFLNHGKLRFTATVAVATCLLSLGTISPAKAEEAKIENLSQDNFECMKRNTDGNGGWIKYEDDNSGRIKVYTGASFAPITVGDVGYNFDPGQKTLTVTSGSGPASFGQIMQGLKDTANKCRN